MIVAFLVVLGLVVSAVLAALASIVFVFALMSDLLVWVRTRHTHRPRAVEMRLCRRGHALITPSISTWCHRCDRGDS